MRAWGHVTLFSPNALNMTAAGRAALRELGLTPPAEDAFPTGDELVDTYLAHIGTFLQQVRPQHSQSLSPCILMSLVFQSGQCEIHLQSGVVGVALEKLLKGDLSPDRRRQQFTVLLERAGAEQVVGGLDILVDTTGTYTHHNHTGPGGLPALGERGLAGAGSILYTLPPAPAPAPSTRHTLVVGCGASAVTSLALLRRGGGAVTWVTRRGRGSPPYTVIQVQVQV